MAQPAEVAEEVVAPADWTRAIVALRYRNFALFFAGALLSNSGALMQAIAVPYVVLQLTGSAVAVSFVSFLLFVPIVVMGPLGGSLADRYDRRRLLLWAQAGQAVLALVLGLAWMAGLRSLLLITVLVVAGGLVNGLNIPAWQAFVSELVPRPVLRNAVTLNSAQFNGARALGPAVGGLVLWRFGPGAAFLLNGLSFVTVIGALLLIRLPRRSTQAVAEGETVWRSFRTALDYGRGVPGIMGCFIVVTALGGLGSPFVQLLPVFAKDVYAVGDREYGLLQAAMGIGAVVTLPFLIGRGAEISRRLVVTWAMVAYGAAVVVFGLSSTYGLSLGALLIAGGAYLGLASVLNTTLQLQVDEEQRGKVIAVYIMLLTASLPAGLLIQSAVVGFAGPKLTVVLFGVAFLAVLGWLAVGPPYLRHLDDEHAPGSAADGPPAPERRQEADEAAHDSASGQSSTRSAAAGHP